MTFAEKLLGPNWVPRILGTVTIGAGVISQSPNLLAHAIPASWIPGVTAWAGIITAISGAFFVGSLKGHNVTGGTIPATDEAIARVEQDAPPSPAASLDIKSTVFPSNSTPK